MTLAGEDGFVAEWSQVVRGTSQAWATGNVVHVRPVAEGEETGVESGSTGGADRHAGVGASELETLTDEGIKMWGDDVRVAGESVVPVVLIVGEVEDDVGSILSSFGGG